MKKYSLYLRWLAALYLPAVVVNGARAQSAIAPAASEWVYAGPGGRLVYRTLEKGDRIQDFSYAGYRGGGVSIPSPSVTITLGPVAGDNTARIQEAIDAVSAMPLKKGFRGVVLLQPGSYSCEGAISIKTGGVVLRGSGSGETGTVINMTGAPHACITLGNNPAYQPVGRPATITDAYVPAGARAFHVSDAGGLRKGDTIRLIRPVTEAWVRFMGMHQLTRNGRRQTWISGDITMERVITGIDGKRISVDLPLTDNYDAQYLSPPGVSVVKVASSGEIAEVGIERLRIVAPEQAVTISQGHHRAFSMRGVRDAWARDIAIFNTENSVSISASRRVTIDRVSIVHTAPTVGAAKPADLNGSGVQLLFNKCTIQGDNLFFFATGAKVTGPVVLLNCTFHGKGWIEPHQRWATGVLVDGCQVPEGGINFMNRGAMGSGHGWAVGWAVAWNCKAGTFLNQQPPGSANWVIGGTGEKTSRAIPFDKAPFLPDGIYDAYGATVTPSSLYLAQLGERLGKQAVKNLGY